MVARIDQDQSTEELPRPTNQRNKRLNILKREILKRITKSFVQDDDDVSELHQPKINQKKHRRSDTGSSANAFPEYSTK